MIFPFRDNQIYTPFLWSFEFLGLWESLPIVGCLSGSLIVFHGRSRSFKVFHLNCYFWFQIYHCQSLAVFQGRWRSPKVFCCFHITQINDKVVGSLPRSFTVAEEDSESIPETQSLAVFAKISFVFPVFDKISNSVTTAKDN